MNTNSLDSEKLRKVILQKKQTNIKEKKTTNLLYSAWIYFFYERIEKRRKKMNITQKIYTHYGRLC